MQYGYGNLWIQLVAISECESNGMWTATMRISELDGLARQKSLESTFHFGASDMVMAEKMAAHLCNRWIDENLQLALSQTKD